MLPVGLGTGSLMLDWLLLEGRANSMKHRQTQLQMIVRSITCAPIVPQCIFTAWSVPVDIFIWVWSYFLTASPSDCHCRMNSRVKHVEHQIFTVNVIVISMCLAFLFFHFIWAFSFATAESFKAAGFEIASTFQ